ncbi:MAG: hypothetical protein ACO3R5_12095, partial [Pseudohongiellaceae bacterium]
SKQSGNKPASPPTGTQGQRPPCQSFPTTLNSANGLFSPEWTWTLRADYNFGLSNGASITPAVSFNQSDMANTSIIQQPGDAYFAAKERDIMNLTLTYRNEDW